MPDHTTASAAIELGITRRRVLNLIKLGRLKAEKFGRDWRIEEASVQALKDSPRKAGRPKRDQTDPIGSVIGSALPADADQGNEQRD